MTYHLGVDLGTTYSAAAVHRDGRSTIVQLGTRTAAIPSVVLLRDDGEFLVGEAAERRAVNEPRRVAREFKRRIGDPTPILLGGSPHSAESLTARLLRAIVETVSEREGGPPASVAISHPANWGPYKIDLLDQAVRIAGLDGVRLVTEPEAAVRHYASQERVDTGSVVAVYDLGGGTFDAAVLRKADEGFESLGRPEGIERLGGIDFDAAVLGYVSEALDGALDPLDPDDPTALQALARLRRECVDAKEGLSHDTEVSIPVLLPHLQTEVRLTRAEFEGLIRPSLGDSLEALRRALAGAGVEPDDVSAVLLVGGSSRVPLVAQLVSNEFGRPIAIDADPKHAIALGTALVAAESSTPSADIAPGATGAAVAGAADPSETESDIVATTPAVDGAPTTVMGATDAATDVLPTTPVPTATATPATGDHAPNEPRRGPGRTPVFIGIAAAVVAALVGGFLVVRGSGGEPTPVDAGAEDAPAATEAPPDTEAPETTTAPTTTDAPTTTAAPTTTEAPETTSTTAATTTTVAGPVPTPCPTEPALTGCITDVDVDDDGGLVAGFTTSGFTPELEPIDLHLHFYFDTVGDEINAGSAGSGGDWRLWDAPNPFTASGGDNGRPGYTLADAEVAGASQLCVIVADVSHAVVPGTGNCIDLPER